MPELGAFPGMFGTIHVVDTYPARKVFSCGKLQGSLMFDPLSDHIYTQCKRGPGPVTNTAYQLAWLMAGTRHRNGRGLMLGLGAGSGAVALLHHFPELVLEAIEIDPVMIEVARAYFPLVSHFERKGCLRIINDDAAGFLSRNQATYDFALIDISVDGAETQKLLLSPDFAASILRHTGEFWINALTARDTAFFSRLIHTYAGLTSLFSTENFSAWLPIQRNWIATSATLNIDEMRALALYPGVVTESAERARKLYANLVTNHMRSSDMSVAS